MKKEIVGLIPVKGDSDRIKQKNFRPFCGTNLFELKLNQLKNAVGFSDIVVSSENEKILETARSYGYTIHERNPKYSTSHISMSEVYSNIASEIRGEHIAWINVTNPLVAGSEYTKVLQAYDAMSPDHDCLLTAYELRSNIFWKNKPLNFSRSPWPRSQDLDPALILSFAINVLKRIDLINWGSCVGEKPYFHLCNPIVSWDIDVQEDFDFCESVYKQMYDLGR